MRALSLYLAYDWLYEHKEDQRRQGGELQIKGKKLSESTFGKRGNNRCCAQLV